MSVFVIFKVVLTGQTGIIARVYLNVVQLAVFDLMGTSMLLHVHHILTLRRRSGLPLGTYSVLVLQRRLMLLVRTRERSLRLLHHDLLVTSEVLLNGLVRVAHLLLHHASHLARVGRRATERLTRRLLVTHLSTRL